MSNAAKPRKRRRLSLRDAIDASFRAGAIPTRLKVNPDGGFELSYGTRLDVALKPDDLKEAANPWDTVLTNDPNTQRPS